MEETNQSPTGDDNTTIQTDSTNQATETQRDSGQETSPQVKDPEAVLKKNQELLAELRAQKDKAAEFEKRLAEIDSLNKEKERKDAEKRGEFERLYAEEKNQRESYEKMVTAYQEKLNGTLDNELGTLSKQFREMFDKMHGDVTDPAVKLEKLSIFKSTIGQFQKAPTDPATKETDEATKKLLAAREKLQKGDIDEIRGISIDELMDATYDSSAKK